MLKLLAVLFAARQRGVEAGAATPTKKSRLSPVIVEEPCEATPAAQHCLYRSFRPLLTAQTGLNHGFSAPALIQKMSLIDLENNCIKTQYIFKH